VRLREGTGPLAVQIILHEMGPLPVIFITATPTACIPNEAESVVLRKPVLNAAVREAFLAVAPASHFN
jgi:hypothetical protein